MVGPSEPEPEAGARAGARANPAGPVSPSLPLRAPPPRAPTHHSSLDGPLRNRCGPRHHRPPGHRILFGWEILGHFVSLHCTGLQPKAGQLFFRYAISRQIAPRVPCARSRRASGDTFFRCEVLRTFATSGRLRGGTQTPTNPMFSTSAEGNPFCGCFSAMGPTGVMERCQTGGSVCARAAGRIQVVAPLRDATTWDRQLTDLRWTVYYWFIAPDL